MDNQKTTCNGWDHRGIGRPGTLALLATLMLVVLGLARSASAQNPPGSYQQSCRDLSVSTAGTLSGNCRNRAGGWQATSLANFRACVGDISNFDGVLQCSKGAPLPRGSYTQTCQDTFVTGTTLHARCKNRGGGWQSTQLGGFSTCRGDIYNFDGQLTCSRGTAAPPRGSYLKSCKDIVVSGSILSAQCRRVNGSFIPATVANTTGCSEISNLDGALVCAGRP